MRAIDATALQRRICGVQCGCNPEECGSEDCKFERFLSFAPTLDVAPVRHGRWEQDYELVKGMEDNSEYPYVACNLCGHREYDVDLNDYTDYDDLPKYCPNCGAKMDAGQEDDENA